MMLSSIFLERMQAKMQKPAVWSSETSYHGRFYDVGWRDDRTMVRLYQAIDRPHRSGLRDSVHSRHRYHTEYTIMVNLTALPAHLASAKVHLLAGKKEDDHVRILFLPEKGPPEIRDLHVTMNQILAKLEEAARAVGQNIGRLSGKLYDRSDEKSWNLFRRLEEDPWQSYESD